MDFVNYLENIIFKVFYKWFTRIYNVETLPPDYDESANSSSSPAVSPPPCYSAALLSSLSEPPPSYRECIKYISIPTTYVDEVALTETSNLNPEDKNKIVHSQHYSESHIYKFNNDDL